MAPRDFCFWLQGFFELEKPNTLGVEQIQMIKDHLTLVFDHTKMAQIVEDRRTTKPQKSKRRKVMYGPLDVENEEPC